MDITKREYVSAVIAWVGTTLRVDPWLINDPACHRSDVVDARRVVAKYLLETTKMPVSEIGGLLGQKCARLGKGLFKFNGEQEWLKNTTVPLKV